MFPWQRPTTVGYRPYADQLPQEQPEPSEDGLYPVILHIYHVGTSLKVKAANALMRFAGTGAYHTGVEVHGLEWSYNEGDFGTGVYCHHPCMAGHHRYNKNIILGYIDLQPMQVQDVVDEMADDWMAYDYDLFRYNCTHFCDDFVQRLGLDPIPRNVVHLATVGRRLDDARSRRALAQGRDPDDHHLFEYRGMKDACRGCLC
jgi:hypothetical protein